MMALAEAARKVRVTGRAITTRRCVQSPERARTGRWAASAVGVSGCCPARCLDASLDVTSVANAYRASREA